MKNVSTFLTLFFLVYNLPFLFSQDLIPYKKGDHFGYSDVEGNIVIAPTFDEVDFFNRHGHGIVTFEGKKLLIDSTGNRVEIKGQELNQGKFDRISTGFHKIYRYRIGRSTGLLDSNFQVILQTSGHSLATTLSPNYFTKRKTVDRVRLTTMIDRSGKELIPYKTGYTRIEMLSKEDQNLLICQDTKEGLYMYLPNGKPIGPAYTKIDFHTLKEEELIFCTREEKIDVYNYQFKLLISGFDFNYFESDENRLSEADATILTPEVRCRIYKTNKKIKTYPPTKSHPCICFDRREKEFQLYAEGKSLLREGEKIVEVLGKPKVFSYEKNGLKGVRTFQDQDLIPLGEQEPVSLSRFRNVVLKTDKGFRLYSNSEKPVDDQLYSEVSTFAIQKKEGTPYAFHYLDGIPRTDYVYEAIKPLYFGRTVIAKKNKHYAILDTLGNPIVQLPYDEVSKLDAYGKILLISKDNKKGIATAEGDVIVAPQYQKITNFDRSHGGDVFIAVDFTGIKSLITSTGDVLQTERRHFDDNAVKKLRDGYFLIKNSKGQSYFFAPNGKKVIQLNSSDITSFSPNFLKKGLVKVNDYFVNYKTGVIYKE